jgi:class 3 adenylate cyclase/tetratricopeptide (TPR) repeat protein
MECPKCQFENKDDSKFCGSCGSSMEIKITCAKCGSKNPDNYNFCNNCGHDLRKPKETPEINYTEPQSYTPKHLADKILTTRSSIEGERKFVTVLFADVANYTSISERLDPEEVHQIMDGCFKILMDEIHKYEGTINQFTGDGMMALFGAPVAHEDHAQRACYAAVKIQGALENYSKELDSRFDTHFKMRIGINSGLVVVGSIGDDLRMDYTAVGDTTNLAARMESSANPGTILLSENTQKLVREFFELESIGEIEVKGKKEFQKVFQLIKTGDVETRIGASIAKGLTRFVGRKNSMSTFTEAFKKIKSGSGQIVGIVGEAGVGKSRLLLEMRTIFPQNDFEYLEGRCLQYGGSIIYLPILDILRSIFNITDDDKEFIVKRKINYAITNLYDQFKSLNSSFQDILSLKVDDEEFTKLEPNKKREKIFEAIRDLLIRMSQEKPLVIAVEDLHWIDKTSEEFLNYFIDWLANTQILLILLYRPEYTHQWGSKSFYTKIGVDQLDMSSSGDLVKAILEEGAVAPELRQLILNRSAGNPLFMEEFTHALVENGSIQKRDNQYFLTGNPEAIKVPDTIQGIIASRLDRLEDNLKRTMQVASVIGRDFAFKILQTITGMKNELKSNLLNLQGLEFIYEKNLFPELEYIFKHALTQEVAYNSLLQKRRQEIHEKIGNAIEKLYAERLEEYLEMLAYHYSKSNNIKKAIHYLRLAGEKAGRNFSHWEAYNFLKSAFEILNSQPDTTEVKKEKQRILLLMITPLSFLGLPDGILEIYESGEKISKELEDSKSVSKFYMCLSTYHSLRGKPNLAIKYAEGAFEEAKKNNDLELMVDSSLVLAIAYTPVGEYQKSIDLLSDVISQIEKEDRKHDFFSCPMVPYSFLCVYGGIAMGNLGFFKNAKELFEKGRINAHETNDLIMMGAIEVANGNILLVKGDWNSSIKHLESGLKLMQKSNFTWMEGFCLCSLGYVHSMLGQIETGKNYAKMGLDIHLKAGVEMHIAHSHFYNGYTHFKSNDFDTAFDLVEKALQTSKKNNETEVEGRILIGLGEIMAHSGKHNSDDAIKQVLIGIDILNKLGMKPQIAQGYLVLGDIFHRGKDHKNAIENLARAEKMFKEMEMNFWLNQTQKLRSMF